MNEANAEATHKSFCDEELTKGAKSKEEKMMTMDDFQSRMDKASSNIATLKEQVRVLQSEIADIDAAQRESAKVRKEEKDNYLKASGDFKASAEAVAQAIQVLKNYYEGAFVQVKAATATVTKAKQPDFGGARSDSGNSIVSVLETAEADFTKMLAEAETAESQAVASFRKLSQEDEVAKAAKLSSVKGRQSEVKSLTVAVGHYKDDHTTANKEFDAVMDYLDKLKPECETKVMSYEERKARREAEIEGLKESLAILDGESVAFLQKKATLRRV
jgi:predicted  nucleic acid-binding Zn-ribbon protein